MTVLAEVTGRARKCKWRAAYSVPHPLVSQNRKQVRISSWIVTQAWASSNLCAEVAVLRLLKRALPRFTRGCRLSVGEMYVGESLLR